MATPLSGLDSSLLQRSLGVTSPPVFAQRQALKYIHAIQPAPWILFDGKNHRGSHTAYDEDDGDAEDVLAHSLGVTSLAIEPHENRYLLTGSADASLSIWDLDSPYANTNTYFPLATHLRSTSSNPHTHTITSTSFPPPSAPYYGANTLISTSYSPLVTVHRVTPTSLRLLSSHTPPATHKPHTHSFSLFSALVALATTSPHIRLLDLRTSTSSHTLAGHASVHGGVLSVAFHPLREHILASGGADGAIRLWDIRRSGACIGLLDKEDSVGRLPHKQKATAHDDGAVNGLTFSPDGHWLVSVGYDARIRVWDCAKGTNTLTNFGYGLRSAGVGTAPPVFAPGQDAIMAVPSEEEVLVCDLSDGAVVRKLKAVRTPGADKVKWFGKGQGWNHNSRLTALAWRAGGGAEGGLYSGGTDGMVRAWLPEESAIDDDGDAKSRADGRTGIEDEEDAEEREAKRKKKNAVFGDIFKSLTSQKITFS